MKPITAVLVFFSLMIPSFILSYGSYATTKESIIDDVNQALAQTILCKKNNQITADTLKVFRSNLKNYQLKEISYLSMCTDEPSKTSFCSDTMSYTYGEQRFLVRAYPNCSKAEIFSMSKQTIPGMIFTISILWGIFSMLYFHRKYNSQPGLNSNEQIIAFGNLSFSISHSLFYNERKEEIYFTPMQQSLIKMLMIDEHKKLSVNEICNRLWPGKENAKETLYTLVRRVKPIIEKNSNVRLLSDKGGYYSLKIENE